MAGRPKKTTTQTKTKVENTKPNVKEEQKQVVKEEPKVERPTQQTKIKKDRSLNEMVCVRNNTHGKLVYVSKRFAGQEYEWEKFGDDNWLELQELIAMRNSYPAYFKECWVMLDDEDLEYLNVKKYYENTINMENFDDIFKLSPTQLRNKLEKLPESMKRSVGERAKQLKDSNELDSLKIIKTLEDVLKIDLSF